MLVLASKLRKRAQTVLVQTSTHACCCAVDYRKPTLMTLCKYLNVSKEENVLRVLKCKTGLNSTTFGGSSALRLTLDTYISVYAL